MQQAANKNRNIKRNKKTSDVTQTTPPQTELDLTRRDIEWCIFIQSGVLSQIIAAMFTRPIQSGVF